MKENALPKTTCILWQIRFSVIGGILCLASLFLLYISILFLIFTGLLLGFFMIMIFWYLPLYFRSYEIKFPNGAIIINRGVFIKTTHIMPYSRMIYAQSISTPLAKYFGLAAILLKAARSSLLIPEIDEADVDDFVESLTRGQNR